MANPTKLIINCETGVQEEIELTDEEVAQLEADRQAAQVAQAERDAEAIAKGAAKASAEAKLTALGLTAEEVAALIK